VTTESLLQRVPPQNLEAERAVLGSLLLVNEHIGHVIDTMSADELYARGHRAIYQAVLDLYNRGEAIDFLTLHTGRKVELPFDVLVVFSTNLPPRDLVDEAFLRRLRHKIEVGDPSYETYRHIFDRVAKDKGVMYSDKGLAYLLQEWYIKRNRKLRASHPRDICDQILDISRYMNVEPEMTKDLIDRAAEAYFVEL